MRFLDKHTTRDKLLLRLERERNRLWQAQRDAPIVPLEHPYQRGWVKTFQLREDVSRRPDAAIFRTILAAVNLKVFSRNREFLNPRGEEILLRPKKLRIDQWRKLAWPASHQRFFAFGHWRADEEAWMPLRLRRLLPGYKLVHNWWLVEDAQPHLITHQRVELPTVRKRLSEIEAYLSHRQGHERLNKLHGRSDWWRRFVESRADIRTNYFIEEQLSREIET
ncbi:MAG: hypothetical protein QM715_10145 [Nibricoccus sp.]